MDKNFLQTILQLFPSFLSFFSGLLNNPSKKKARLVRRLNRWERKGKITKEEKQELLKEMGIMTKSPQKKTEIQTLYPNLK